MFLFYVLSFFKKGDTIQGGKLFKGGHYRLEKVLTGDTIQGGTLFKGGH